MFNHLKALPHQSLRRIILLAFTIPCQSPSKAYKTLLKRTKMLTYLYQSLSKHYQTLPSHIKTFHKLNRNSKPHYILYELSQSTSLHYQTLTPRLNQTKPLQNHTNPCQTNSEHNPNQRLVKSY